MIKIDGNWAWDPDNLPIIATSQLHYRRNDNGTVSILAQAYQRMDFIDDAYYRIVIARSEGLSIEDICTCDKTKICKVCLVVSVERPGATWSCVVIAKKFPFGRMWFTRSFCFGVPATLVAGAAFGREGHINAARQYWFDCCVTAYQHLYTFTQLNADIRYTIMILLARIFINNIAQLTFFA